MTEHYSSLDLIYTCYKRQLLHLFHFQFLINLSELLALLLVGYGVKSSKVRGLQGCTFP